MGSGMGAWLGGYGKWFVFETGSGQWHGGWDKHGMVGKWTWHAASKGYMIPSLFSDNR